MKKIIKSICFSVLAFLFAIGSFFVPVTSKNINSAHADSTSVGNVTFEGSQVIFSRLGVISRQWQLTDYYQGMPGLVNFASLGMPNNNALVFDIFTQWYNWSFYLEKTSNTTVLFSCYSYLSDVYGLAPSSVSTQVERIYLGEVRVGTTGTMLFDIIYDTTECVIINDGVFVGNTAVGYGLLEPSSDDNPLPTLEMVSIEIGNYYNFADSYLFPECCVQSNIVCYTDTSGYRYYFFIPSFDYPGASSYLDYRKYYTPNALDFTNNDIYQQGFVNGSASGYDKGYTQGYSEGNSSGYNEGYDEGLIDGAVNSNDYSFFGLISAVIDTPIQLFKSLFNFNFLGVNLFAFFTSILTIGLIVFVTKLFLRR